AGRRRTRPWSDLARACSLGERRSAIRRVSAPACTSLVGRGNDGSVHLLREIADDLVQGAADATRQSGEHADRADRDHGEDDTVLRHRLTLLLAPMRPEKLKPLGKRHGIHLPSFHSRAPTGALQAVIKLRSQAAVWSTLVRKFRVVFGVAAPPAAFIVRE